MKKHTLGDLKAIMLASKKKAGSLRKLAIELEISAAYLSDILKGKRGVSEKVAAKFGFDRHIEVTTTEYFTRSKEAP